MTSPATAELPALARATRPRDLRAAAREELAACLARATQGVVSVSVAAPVAPVIGVARALRKTDTWLFESADGSASLGLGAAARTTVSGPARFAAARAWLTALRARARGAPLRFFTGFAFAPGSAREDAWSGFGDGAVVLPRWHYRVAEGRASLTFACDADAARASEVLALAELDAIFDALEEPRVLVPDAPGDVRVAHLDERTWARAIDAIRGAIQRGEASKIVAARRSSITAGRDFDALEVLARLPSAGATRFLVQRGARAFLGATPERLFRLEGRRVETEALAGSIAAGEPWAEERLLMSAKDREEHAYVVQHLLERLGARALRVTSDPSPSLRRLSTVVHLHTPVEAQLASDADAFDLLESLHPTPALGGTPAAAAVPWILAHEPAPRGWYGGPIGWIDADGRAQLFVALRCGLVHGARALAWAGGGIVADSEARAEHDETRLKMRPFLRALGASEG